MNPTEPGHESDDAQEPAPIAASSYFTESSERGAPALAVETSRPPGDTRRESYPTLPPRLDVGQRLGQYHLEAEICRGAAATVYRARRQGERNAVALKVLSPHLGLVPSAVERFRFESALVAGISHPSVIAVHDEGEAVGHWFYSMELHAGRTVSDLRDATDSPTTDSFCRGAARLFAALARALEYIHSQGVVHRDIKPDNILLGKGGNLILCDFGSALDLRNPNPVLEDSLWGTVRYMSPEQFLPDANPHDPSLDIYSLGATLYEVVTGRPVFPRIPPVDLVRWKLTRKPARPRELDPAVPMSLEAIVLEAMESEPRLRHPSAGDLADDLERFAEGRRGHHR